jgi:N-terminal double-transmembrane domain
MSLLSPLALLAAAIIGPLIVAMYMLKLRREERTVSSTFLWQRLVRDVEANAPWQKLKRNLLLFLQLLLMLLLVFALARPFFRTQGISGRNLILIVDRSASMGAIDDGRSRLEQAKAQAISLIEQLPDGGRATIIAAGGQMEVPVSATTDQRELRNAIAAIELQHGGGSDLSQALTMASALAEREAESEIAIISDGNVSLPEELKVPATVRYFPIGSRSDNSAISALALQPSAAGQTLFAQAINYGESSVERRLDIYLDGTLFNAYNLTLEPNREQSIVLEVPASVKLAEARLDGEDGLLSDNQAWAASTVGDITRVRVIGEGNRFLEVGLSLLPGIQVTNVPTSTSTFTETVAEVPVTILDGFVPDTLPVGNLLFIAPPRSTEFFSVTGQIEFPVLRPLLSDEPLLRNVSLSEVSVYRANRLAPGTWARILVDSDGAPILFVGEQQGRRIAVLAFDLHQSDLPLQVAFPLLLSNLMSYLAPGSGAEAAQLLPGQALALQTDPSISRVDVITPDGRRHQASLQDNQAIFGETDQLGVYSVEEYRGNELVVSRNYTVNLFAPNESRIAPKTELAVQQRSGLQNATTGARDGRLEIWRWLAGLALIVLVIEWLVYQRNSIIYLRERWRTRRSA